MNKKAGKKKLTNQRMMHFLMDEMVDIRNELKQEIMNFRNELKADIQNLDRKLSGRIDGLARDVIIIKTDVSSLRLELHQNQLTFMKNHDDLEKRVDILETAAA